MSQYKDQLPVMESFNTIQGEGYHQDVGCTWCDVKESWPADEHPLKKIDQIIEPLKRIKNDVVVITGGEPLMHNLNDLTQSIKMLNKNTHIETSGAHKLTGAWDWICLSPKKFKAPLDDFFEVADELKIIVYNKNDFKWAETILH